MTSTNKSSEAVRRQLLMLILTTLRISDVGLLDECLMPYCPAKGCNFAERHRKPRRHRVAHPLNRRPDARCRSATGCYLIAVGPASSWPGTEGGGAAVTVAVLMANGSGLRAMEFAVGVIVLLISPCYLAEMAMTPLDWCGIAISLVMSLIPDGMALRTTVWASFGAAVTPHALCLCAFRSLTAGYPELAALVRHRSGALRGGAEGGLDLAIN
ncbi:Divalent metal cation transporter MntH [Colletotrichum fructicola]|nr:Divalent metal cation transporter MntH [Colletotrichum fructicola]